MVQSGYAGDKSTGYYVKTLPQQNIMRFILSILFILTQLHSFSQLNVSIDNIKRDSGTVLIALYNSKNSFNNIKEVYREGRAGVKGKKAVFTFEDLPPGEYAISLFHDINNNEVMDKSDAGLPVEPYGFSNNARGNFGPPSYKKAKFTYDGKSMDISIMIK